VTTGKNPAYDNGMARLYQADARAIPLPDESVHCVVTSPPYWGLRDYGLEPSVWGGDDHEHEWGNEQRGKRADLKPPSESSSMSRMGSDDSQGLGPPSGGHFCACGAWRGNLGLEPTPELFVEHLVEVMREVRRVLRKDGTCWLNLGDSYANDGKWGGSTGGKHAAGLHGATGVGRVKTTPGLKPKDLMMMPARVALALQADGWWVRSDIIWAKPNPMPESARDRPTSSYEHLFLLTKAERYYYDAEAIREPGQGRLDRWPGSNGRIGHQGWKAEPLDNPAGRNKRDVWTIATQSFGMEMCEACGLIYTAAQYGRLPKVEYQELDVETEEWETKTAKRCRKCHGHDAWMSHFATFPSALVEPCILAGTSERGVCAECGAPWVRVVERIPTGQTQKMADGWDTGNGAHGTIHRDGREQGRTGVPVTAAQTTGWRAGCDHDAGGVPATVLDPFAGSGTTVVVAQRLGRRAVGLDLSADYLKLAEERLRVVPVPMVLA
jgi:DNA modification methylase